jgi:hypothetical protein
LTWCEEAVSVANMFLGALRAALITALLAACAAAPPVSDEEGTSAAGYGRVFGRVQYTYNGAPTELGASLLGSHNVTLFLRPVGSDEMQYLKAESDGSFSWPLKPGNYVLIGYTVERTAGSYREGITRRWMAPIAVPEPGAAVYIGDLRVQSDKGRYRTELVDDYEETLKRAQPKLAAGKFRPVRAVLRPEPAPGKVKTVRAICAPAWGLTCTEANQGVEPVRPVAFGQNFPTVESLTPLLEWKPAARTDLAYDVAIYESLSFEYAAGTARVNRMLGSLVGYAEGLTEPKYTPAVPLQPGRKYEWSVRLRDGDTVSTWSTTSSSLNLIVAGRSASGQMFGFETPAK